MSIVQVATKALIMKEGKILVLKDNSAKGKDLVDIPGGRMHHGLTLEENLKREVKEELSIDINIKEPAGIWYFFRSDNNDQIVCITYICEPLSDSIDLSNNPDPNEILTEYYWVTPEEFMKLKSDDTEGLERLQKVVREYFKLN